MATATQKKTERSKPTGPSTLDLVVKAITQLKEPRGSSVSAVKKTLASMGVDTVKKNNFINSALKRGVATGVLKQVKGTGASGTFKLDTAKALATQKAKVQKEKTKARKAAASEKAKTKKAASKAKKATQKKGKKPAKKVVKKSGTKKASKPKKAVKPKKKAAKKPVKKVAKKSPKKSKK